MRQFVAELAPTGVLRAGINMSNLLLVTGANRIGRSARRRARYGRRDRPAAWCSGDYVKFDRPSQLADAAGTNVWDIGLIGAEPARAEKIAFTAAYCEIEATYLVPRGLAVQNRCRCRPCRFRIAVRRGAAYDLWLERNIKHATVLRSDTADGPLNQFVAESFEALCRACGPQLLKDVKKVPGAKILPGNFTAVQQAIGTAQSNTAGAAFLARLCRGSKEVGSGGAPDREASRRRPFGRALAASPSSAGKRLDTADRLQPRPRVDFRLRQHAGLRAETLDDAAHERPDGGRRHQYRRLALARRLLEFLPDQLMNSVSFDGCMARLRSSP